jgi:hypothetical protein
LLLLLTVAACASNPAPRGALPSEENVDRSPYGGWIYVERNARQAVQGELLSARDDSVVVLTEDGAQTVAREAIQYAEVGVFEAQMAGLTTWTVVGTLSTISNGLFLIFTAPMWIIGGGFSLARVSKQPIYKWNENEPLSSLARFARFPGGMPDNVDRTTLTSPMLMRQQ